MMLVEAIKASLQEAAKKGLVDATPQPSQELPQLPSQSSDRSPGKFFSPVIIHAPGMYMLGSLTKSML